MPTTVGQTNANFTVWEETDPAYIPNSVEVLTTKTVWVEEIILTGAAAASAAVTITDTAGLPLANLVSLANGEIYHKILGARKCVGIKWSCNAANSIVGFVRWKY